MAVQIQYYLDKTAKQGKQITILLILGHSRIKGDGKVDGNASLTINNTV